MNNYKHKVQYYETDKMGITHHSNYVRWMEEARVSYLKELGWDFKKLEEIGLASPVTAIDCKYKLPTTFDDEVTIEASMEECRGVKLKIKYVMTNEEGKVVFEGHTEHCFLNSEGKIVRVSQEYPEFYQAIMATMK